MLSSLIITFRESLEITLIIGAVLAATNGIAGRGKYISIGVLAGIIGSVAIAYFLNQASESATKYNEYFIESLVLGTACALIIWTVLWMQSHAKKLTSDIRGTASQIRAGDKTFLSLTLIIALAILREGAEIILLSASLIQDGETLSNVIIGGVIGFLIGALIGALLFIGLIKVKPVYFFKTTTVLLSLIAAGLAASLAKRLIKLDIVPESLTAIAWDTTHILEKKSHLGSFLHAFIGYADKPMALQVIFYVLVLAFIYLTLKLRARKN